MMGSECSSVFKSNQCRLLKILLISASASQPQRSVLGALRMKSL